MICFECGVSELEPRQVVDTFGYLDGGETIMLTANITAFICPTCGAGACGEEAEDARMEARRAYERMRG